MKASFTALLPLVALLAPSAAFAASEGNLYLIDTDKPSIALQDTSITAETARLIIASRLHLDHFHSLGHVDQATLGALNAVSPAQDIFEPADEAPVALLLAEGIELDNTFSTSAHMQISNMPSASATEDLILNLAVQAGASAHGKRTSQISELNHGLVFAPSGSVFIIVSDEHDLTTTVQSLKSQEYTILILQTSSSSTKSKHSFGKYDMPAKTSAIHKRQFKEAPIVSDDSDVDFYPLDDSSLTSSAKNSSGPLRGILPECFSSLSACQSTTRDCTGHGECKLKYTDKDASSSGAPCYACQCSSEVRTNKDGTKKTTQWGGPACQKKNVVMPFWLLAGFSVVFMFIISWGIGLLYSMGEQDLPSVIGAGVSGPRAK